MTTVCFMLKQSSDPILVLMCIIYAHVNIITINNKAINNKVNNNYKITAFGSTIISAH